MNNAFSSYFTVIYDGFSYSRGRNGFLRDCSQKLVYLLSVGHYYYYYYQTYFDTVTNQPLPYLAYYLHIYKVKLKWLLFIRPCIIKNIKNYKN